MPVRPDRLADSHLRAATPPLENRLRRSTHAASLGRVNPGDVLDQVRVYLAREGWHWERVSLHGKRVTGSDRSFDFRTDAFSDAQEKNPGVTVRRGTPPRTK